MDFITAKDALTKTQEARDRIGTTHFKDNEEFRDACRELKARIITEAANGHDYVIIEPSADIWEVFVKYQRKIEAALQRVGYDVSFDNPDGTFVVGW